ncbi:MAG TPA: hypothetical protein VM010_08915 [Chitinophagaceae bacterium]|nr:hypothetical protein [Chitinophagaceae bacterium]
MRNSVTERKIAAALFVVVLITSSLAQRDSKRLDRLYTLKLNKKENVAVQQQPPLHVK